MNEDFLHYVWKYQLFSIENLRSVNKQELIILKSGQHNNNSGPDFLNAQIKFNNQLWVGNVEIHIKSSDWYAHNHEVDKNYDAVILHVVWEDDVTVFMNNNKPLPTLVLKKFVLSSAINNYRDLFSNQKRWIPCEKEINSVDIFVFENWKERLFFERLERKSNEVKQLLEVNKNDFEAALFLLLAKNFGLKVNGEAFFNLAKSIDFSIIKKVRFDENQFLALLFGQAGFLEEIVEEEYHRELKSEYEYLKHKYKLNSFDSNEFSFFRMRPNNFPTIRIAQLVSLFHQHQNLFSKLIEIKNIEDFYTLLEVNVHPFWKMHYTFKKESKPSSKKLTKSFIDLLLINTIVPLKFLYQKTRGKVDESEFLEILRTIKLEKNSIVSKFDNIGIKAESAYETQALLELKNNYCAKKLCLQCAIGVSLMNES